MHPFLRTAALVLGLLAVLGSAADAKGRHHRAARAPAVPATAPATASATAPATATNGGWFMPADAAATSRIEGRRHHYARHHAGKIREERRRNTAPMREAARARPETPSVGNPIQRAAAAVNGGVNILRDYAASLVHRGNAPTDRLPSELRAKLAEIQGVCPGFSVISTVCGAGHSLHVKGTGRVSLHCVDKAADFVTTDYSCAYAHLTDWPGGLSGDPGAVGHVHLSYAPGSHEFGARFCHGGHGGAGCMFAHHGDGGRRHYARRHGHGEHRFAARA